MEALGISGSPVVIGKFFGWARYSGSLVIADRRKLIPSNASEASVNDEFNISRDKSFDMNEEAACTFAWPFTCRFGIRSLSKFS